MRALHGSCLLPSPVCICKEVEDGLCSAQQAGTLNLSKNPNISDNEPDICDNLSQILLIICQLFVNIYKSNIPYTSKLAFFAWLSMNRFLGPTSSPISMLNVLSASTASSILTFNTVLFAGSIVVSHKVSGFISPRPLYLPTSGSLPLCADAYSAISLSLSSSLYTYCTFLPILMW